MASNYKTVFLVSVHIIRYIIGIHGLVIPVGFLFFFLVSYSGNVE